MTPQEKAEQIVATLMASRGDYAGLKQNIAAAILEGPGWTRVEDGLPKSRDNCLCIGRRAEDVNDEFTAWHGSDSWFKGGEEVWVTHWRPLPAPPKEGE